ncbi:MAG: TatD family hydrolase [Clostridia bacterium]|nr:TatD family hydrolase [Clostridia bacterium]
MGNIFDTHAHYDDEAFNNDRYELLDRLLSGEVCGIVNQGTTVRTSEFSLELAHKYNNMYAAVGIHPECADENSMKELSVIRELCSDKKAVAVGEIGLDYYYDVPRELQKQVFEAQLRLAGELTLPVVIHDREAHGDVLDFIRKYRPKGIVHCFSGSREMAEEVVRLGMYIGMGGVITFKNARKSVEVIESVPAEFLVLETDCPYLAPVPFRGKRNDSSLIRFCAERIAEIKGMSTEELLKITAENAKTVYGLN